MHSSKLRSKPQEETGSTADFLLDSAEKLFAEKGIENVSLRQIVAASGHGNLSGAHYHFGTRDALILKLVERRMLIVNRMRNAVLDRVIADSAADNLAHIVTQTVENLATVVTEFSWGRDYLLITAQALFIPRLQLEHAVSKDAISGNERLARMLKHLMRHLSQGAIEQRYQMFQHETVYAFARWLQANGPITQTNRKSFDAMTSRVVSFMVGGLLAPET